MRKVTLLGKQPSTHLAAVSPISPLAGFIVLQVALEAGYTAVRFFIHVVAFAWGLISISDDGATIKSLGQYIYLKSWLRMIVGRSLALHSAGQKGVRVSLLFYFFHFTFHCILPPTLDESFGKLLSGSSSLVRTVSIFTS